jgi:hypothetical protein
MPTLRTASMRSPAPWPDPSGSLARRVMSYWVREEKLEMPDGIGEVGESPNRRSGRGETRMESSRLLRASDRREAVGPSAPPVVMVGRLVEDQDDRPAGVALEDGPGQLRPGGRRGGGARCHGGELAGVAMPGHGHGDVEAGQGVGLVAVEVRQELVAHRLAPFVYNGLGARGWAPEVEGPRSPSRKCMGVRPV